MSRIFPPFENAIICAPIFLAFSNSDMVSVVFPEMLVITTNESELTVFGKL